MQGNRQPPRRVRNPKGLGAHGDPYSGYGISTPQPCPPTADEALAECLRALQQIFRDTLQISDLAPWIHPPFRARTICEFSRSILSTTLALNAGVNAAGLALQSALTVPGTPPLVPPLLEMGAVGEFQTLFELKEPINTTTRVASWGITVNNVDPAAVLVKVNVSSTAGGPPSPPSPFLSSTEVAGHQPVFLLVPGNQVLKVEVALRDTTSSPAVIDFGICAWSWPVRNRDDSPEGVIPRSGYGMDCA